MKRIIVTLSITLLCVNICFYSSISKESAYTTEISNEISIKGISIKEHIITAKYSDETMELPYLNASIKFPQVYDMEDKPTQEKINKQLRDVAMILINNQNSDETLKLFSDIANGEINSFWGGSNEYKILCAKGKSMSLNYSGNVHFGGAYPHFFSDYVTIDLYNGKLVPFTDYFSKESVIEAVISRKFEWIDGQYTGGYKGDEPELIDNFAEAIKKLTDVDTENNVYERGSTYNFATDGQYAYISMPFYDSLDGYIVLKFNIDYLKQLENYVSYEENPAILSHEWMVWG